eukprot:TRINITY_DN16155_c0_g2_i1.p1 TRINITY_DN16155_c0_g2~~TRINITY_DN16155_c0_g2_i1.p1  ORF type:complete len:457 (+),score=37.72 TRINITY_DN16155_c0_g2_i1:68-1438(+)
MSRDHGEPAGADLPGWTVRTYVYPYGKRNRYFGPHGMYAQSRAEAIRKHQGSSANGEHVAKSAPLRRVLAARDIQPMTSRSSALTTDSNSGHLDRSSMCDDHRVVQPRQSAHSSMLQAHASGDLGNRDVKRHISKMVPGSGCHSTTLQTGGHRKLQRQRSLGTKAIDASAPEVKKDTPLTENRGAWLSAEHMCNLLDDPSAPLPSSRAENHVASTSWLCLSTSAAPAVADNVQVGAASSMSHQAYHSKPSDAQDADRTCVNVAKNERSETATVASADNTTVLAAGSKSADEKQVPATVSKRAYASLADDVSGSIDAGQRCMEKAWSCQLSSLTEQIQQVRQSLLAFEDQLKLLAPTANLEAMALKEEGDSRAKALEECKADIEDRIRGFENKIAEAQEAKRNIERQLDTIRAEFKIRIAELPLVQRVSELEGHCNRLRGEEVSLLAKYNEVSSWKV